MLRLVCGYLVYFRISVIGTADWVIEISLMLLISFKLADFTN